MTKVITYIDGADDVELDRWNAVYITGRSVSRTTAREILMRTDGNIRSMRLSTNAHEFKAHVTNAFGWSVVQAWDEVWHRLSDDERDQFRTITGVNTPVIDERFASRVGTIPLSSMGTDLLCSCYVGGPTSWVTPNGTIFMMDKNLGKWPEVKSIAMDWASIAEKFYELDLVCTVMDGEWCSDERLSPVVQYVVKNGAVTVQPPVMELHDPVYDFDLFGDARFNLSYDDSSLYISTKWPSDLIAEFAGRSVRAMYELTKNLPMPPEPKTNNKNNKNWCTMSSSNQSRNL